MSKHINRLGSQNQYLLTRYFDTEENRVLLGKESDQPCADRATKDLGFTVNALNIRGVRQLLGIRKRAANGAKSADIEALTDLVSTQAKKIDRLEHNVQNLLDRVLKLEQRPKV